MATKRETKVSPVLHTLMDAAVDLHQNPDDVERSYMARQLVQCTLPHSDPGNIPIWRRRNGDATLSIRPYIDESDKALYPFGSIPRLLLFWLCTEAVQKKTRHIKLGNSLDAFMREVGLNPRTGGGKRGDAARLHSQMERLFRAVVSFEDTRQGKRYVDMQVGPRAQLWWDPARTRQDDLWESWVDLGEDFFAAITAAPVPVDRRVLRALKRSPLALDLYALLTHAAYTATKTGASRKIPWDGLHNQLGTEYAHIRMFRAKVLLSLKKIALVYPGLKLETTTTELVIHPSRTSISAKV